MTPLADLGFLLISFFVITTELARPKAADLLMPKDSLIDMPVGESDALTVLPGKDNNLFYYEGTWKEAFEKNKILLTNFSYNDGIGKVIRKKQLHLDNNPNAREGRAGLMLIIRPGQDASYSAIVDLLDEVLISDVKKYVIAKQTPEEAMWLQQH